ncbi:MAG: HPr family phosphocarrier protein [Selenomonadaceae bacterium]|nr:HPr family phosphocarrier protein [Selenomonadaceae bacterium]
MKKTFKKVENINIDVSSKELEKYGAVVSFIMVAKGILALRECAHIVKIAEETGCLVRLISGKKVGSSNSILSLINLEITPGKSLVLSIHGARNQEAFGKISKVIAGETDSNEK